MFSFTGAHSLHYNFSITAKGQPWCKVRGQVDEKNFLSYDCGSNKMVSMNLLREEVNATHVWKAQLDTLGHMGHVLKQELPDVKPDKDTDGGKREKST